MITAFLWEKSNGFVTKKEEAKFTMQISNFKNQKSVCKHTPLVRYNISVILLQFPFSIYIIMQTPFKKEKGRGQ